jgi:hypothetical protein
VCQFFLSAPAAVLSSPRAQIGDGSPNSRKLLLGVEVVAPPVVSLPHFHQWRGSSWVSGRPFLDILGESASVALQARAVLFEDDEQFENLGQLTFR